jgi:hypothetical protein
MQLSGNIDWPGAAGWVDTHVGRTCTAVCNSCVYGMHVS